jgi:hypothetical protein
MTGDVIMEERQWRHGIEIVSHVNHSQISRIRASRSRSVDPCRSPAAGRPRLIAEGAPPAKHGTRTPRAVRRVAVGS